VLYWFAVWWIQVLIADVDPDPERLTDRTFTYVCVRIGLLFSVLRIRIFSSLIPIPGSEKKCTESQIQIRNKEFKSLYVLVQLS
jgi:hypothetical protein